MTCVETISGVGGADTELHEGGITIVRYPGGHQLVTTPEGGGVGVFVATREQVFALHLMADFFRLTYSPTLNGAATGAEMNPAVTDAEKALCEALEAYAPLAGETLLDMARRVAGEQRRTAGIVDVFAFQERP